jgi:hypothetical protein
MASTVYGGWTRLCGLSTALLTACRRIRPCYIIRELGTSHMRTELGRAACSERGKSFLLLFGFGLRATCCQCSTEAALRSLLHALDPRTRLRQPTIVQSHSPRPSDYVPKRLRPRKVSTLMRKRHERQMIVGTRSGTSRVPSAGFCTFLSRCAVLTRHLFFPSRRTWQWSASHPTPTRARVQSHKKPSGSILRARAYDTTTSNHVFKHLSRPSLFAHPPRYTVRGRRIVAQHSFTTSGGAMTGIR